MATGSCGGGGGGGGDNDEEEGACLAVFLAFFSAALASLAAFSFPFFNLSFFFRRASRFPLLTMEAPARSTGRAAESSSIVLAGV